MNWLRKHKIIILVGLIFFFILSMFAGFGLYHGTGRSNVDTVAEVNEEDIPYNSFTTLYNQIVNRRRDAGDELSQDDLNKIKQEVIQSLIQESVFYQESQRYNMEVSDMDVLQTLASIPAFQKDGKFDVPTYAKALRFGLRTTPEHFEETQKRQIAINRLRAFVMRGIKITDKEVEQEYAQRKQQSTKKVKSKKSKEEELTEFKNQLYNEKGPHILNRWYQQLGGNVQVKVHLNDIERNRGKVN